MRFFAGVLSVYFILQAFVPCTDEAGHSHQDNLEIAVALHAEDGCADRAHHEDDGCSPLCFCHCCHTHISPAQSHTVVVDQFATPADHIDPVHTRGIQLVVGVFHPPKS